MKQDTLKITTGAMFIAIFAVFMIINRQTGGLFEGVVMYLLPIPMVAYSARYGFVAGIPVMIAMGLMAFFFGNVTSIIYAMTATLTGLIFGTCIYKKVEGTKTLFTVMLASAVGEVANLVIFAAFLGLDIHREADEYRQIFMESVDKAMSMTQNPQGAQIISLYEQILTPDMMLRMLIISTVVAGLIQGFIIYKISLMILNKLRFKIAKPVSIFTVTPPRWISFLASDLLILYFLANMVQNEKIRTILQTLGLCAILYLVFFGFLQVIYYFRVRTSQPRFIGFLLAFALLMFFSVGLVVFGLNYVFKHDGKEAAEFLAKQDSQKKSAGYASAPQNRLAAGLQQTGSASGGRAVPSNNGRAASAEGRKNAPKKNSMAYKANLMSMLEDRAEEAKADAEQAEIKEADAKKVAVEQTEVENAVAKQAETDDTTADTEKL